MIASRSTVGLAVLVTVVLVISAMGLISAVGGLPAQASPAPRSASVTPAGNSPIQEPSANGAASPSSTNPSTPSPSFAAPPTPKIDQVPNHDASTSVGAQVLQTLAAKGVPTHDIYLPYFLNGPHPGLTNGHVNLSYKSSPAPYGIGDFGLKNVSGVITPYTLSTKSVEANFSTDYLAGYSSDLSSPDEWGVQLNAVLNNVTLFGQTGYQFWTQDVFAYSPALGTIEFVSNIWNFSNPTATLSCNFLYQSDGSNLCPTYYYGVSASIPVTEPFHVQLYLNSTLIGGRDAVFFNYSLSSGLGTTGGNFDYAIFNSTAPGGNPALTKAPAYVANGFAYDPFGLPDDFEVTLTGPGGGSNFDVFESDSTYMTLQYWNDTAGNYTTVPSAYNVAGETGETSVGVNAAWSEFGTTGVFPARCVECVTLTNGPSFQYGLWGVRGATPAGNIVPETYWDIQSSPYFILDPPNAFLFVAEGDVFTSWPGTNWSLFQWVPDFAPYDYYTDFPVGNYTFVVVLADHEAEYGTFSITSDTGEYPVISVSVGVDTTYGVYTPLWAFNDSGLQNISSGVDGYLNEILYDNQYATIGEIPLTADAGTNDGTYFPWFGAFNDAGYPVFPGILVANVDYFDVLSAPSFSVSAPPGAGYQAAIHYFGWPETNDLQMFFWDDNSMNLESSTVNGWFPAVSDFGPSQSFASVVLWNTTDSVISDNTFATGGMGLFLYGGEYNRIVNNTFISGAAPLSSNPYATAAEYYGAVGLVDADWGDASYYGADGSYLCDVCDTIYNNVFDTFVTATSLYYDPYTGNLPALYPYDFSEAWNIPYEAGPTNIIGGHYLGGNYWWDYGYADNPYGLLPDQEVNYLPYVEFGAPPGYIGDEYTGMGGDYYPLVSVALHNITFEEHGLPSGVGWDVYVYVPPLYTFQADYAYNETTAPGILNFTETAGTWYYYPYSTDRNFAAVHGSVVITDKNVVVVVDFQAAFVLKVTETGLPSGTDWYAEAYSSELESARAGTGTSVNVSGLLPGTYTWYAFAEDVSYAGVPYDSMVTISGNTTVSVTFVPIYTLDVNAVGLPPGTLWVFTLTSPSGYNYTYGDYGAWLNISTAAATYYWTASANGYFATPASGTLTLSANTTVTVTFQAGAALTFTETGLPAGTSWSVALTQGSGTTVLGGTGSSLLFSAAAGAYSYTVSASGYAATPASGSGTLPADSTVAVTFATATGGLGGTVSPSGATLWVDGVQQALGSGGTYSLTVSVGTHSIEVTDSGYVPYFNNATVTLDKTTTVNITLTAVSSSSGIAGISSTGWLIIGALAVLALILLVTTLAFSRRRRQQPPPVAPYAAPSAPPAAAPPWQEPPPPPGSS